MKDNVEQRNNNFNIKMDTAIIINIVKQALKNNENVHSLSENLLDTINKSIFKKNKNETGIKVALSEEGYVVDIFLIVKYEVQIPRLAWDLQSQIKHSIEKKFGTKVSKVNIHIQGVTTH